MPSRPDLIPPSPGAEPTTASSRPAQPRKPRPGPSRRHLLAGAGGALALGALSPFDRFAFAREQTPTGSEQAVPETGSNQPPWAPPVLVTEPWARIERLDEGVFAVISTLDSGDNKTVCNGGLVVGQRRCLAIDAYMGADGAAWVGQQGMRLGGKRPTDIVITHYHADHCRGLAGFSGDADGRGLEPTAWMTETTRGLIRERNARDGALDPALAAVLERARILDPEKPTELDLGGRTARILPLGGHTPSDVVVVTEGRRPALFWGDLMWNGFFPNYMDATPSTLAASVARLSTEYGDHQHVGGHGPRATLDDVEQYSALLEHVGEHARRQHGKGNPADEAAAAYALPEACADWVVFGPRFVPNAIGAWYAELEG